MSRLVYICPITGLIILTEEFARTIHLLHMQELHFAIDCPACCEQHWTSIARCRAYPAKEGGALRAEAS
jgi:hypothetical protein